MQLTLSCCWLRLGQQYRQSFPLPVETERLSLPLNSEFLCGLGMALEGLIFPLLLHGGPVTSARSRSSSCSMHKGYATLNLPSSGGVGAVSGAA